MRIATWNLWHRFGPWQQRAAAIRRVLTELDADLLCLQEVWTEPQTGRSQARELADALGLRDVVDAHRVSHEGLTFGNAIVSRWPVEDVEIRPLTPHPTYDEHRTVVGARVRTPIGEIHVFCSHLNFLPYQSAVRQSQVRDIAQLVLDWAHHTPALPPVVAGDLNAEPVSDEIRMLTGRADLGLPVTLWDAWDWVAGTKPAATWDNRNPFARASSEPDRRIDYILTGNPKAHGGRGRVQGCRVFGDGPVDGVWPSDHLGVVVDLSTSPESQPTAGR